MPSQTSLLGAAGEHYVMSELLRRGYIAALAPQGVPNADIIVCDVEGTRLCSIQVKTRRERGRDGGWHMKEKHEKLRSDTLFYCFVDFGTGVNAPVVYVVPSPHVAEALERSHRTWLSTPGKKGQVATLLGAGDQDVLRWFILVVAVLLDPAAVLLLLA